MEAKKTPKADLEGKKIIFTQIGLIIALAATLLAFEWKSYDKTVEGFGERVVAVEDEEIIPITEQKVKPPPPPPPPPPAAEPAFPDLPTGVCALGEIWDTGFPPVWGGTARDSTPRRRAHAARSG